MIGRDEPEERHHVAAVVSRVDGAIERVDDDCRRLRAARHGWRCLRAAGRVGAVAGGAVDHGQGVVETVGHIREVSGWVDGHAAGVLVPDDRSVTSAHSQW
jgi:hypothetical protein